MTKEALGGNMAQLELVKEEMNVRRSVEPGIKE